MPLTLTDQDIGEFNALLDSLLMRPSDGARLLAFFQNRQQRQEATERAKEMRPKAMEAPSADIKPEARPATNGAAHADAMA